MSAFPNGVTTNQAYVDALRYLKSASTHAPFIWSNARSGTNRQEWSKATTPAKLGPEQAAPDRRAFVLEVLNVLSVLPDVLLPMVTGYLFRTWEHVREDIQNALSDLRTDRDEMKDFQYIPPYYITANVHRDDVCLWWLSAWPCDASALAFEWKSRTLHRKFEPPRHKAAAKQHGPEHLKAVQSTYMAIIAAGDVDVYPPVSFVFHTHNTEETDDWRCALWLFQNRFELQTQPPLSNHCDRCDHLGLCKLTRESCDRLCIMFH